MRIALTFATPLADAYRSAGGPWDAPTLDELLRGAAARASDTVLVVDDEVRITGGELLERVDRVAALLLARGVAPGDTVCWQLGNCAEAIVASRACWRIGAVAAPLHPSFTAVEVERAAARVAPVATLDADEITYAPEHHEPLTDSVIAVDAGALAAVLFTSGSSGAPKGVLHTQATLAYKATTMAEVHGLHPGDVVLMPAPLAHVSGLLNGITAPGVVPFRTVLMRRWNPDDALDLVEREGVTFMVGPPTFFVGMMRSPRFTNERVASLRLVSSGGAGVSDAFVAEASERLGCVVKRTYGSTEAPSVASVIDGAPDDAPRAVGACELRIDGHGELLVRGPEVCAGYLDAADTARAFDADGWYRTGDLATLDAGGRLAILGRADDVIIRGGENISATEVEAVLERHPDVGQCAIVGVPDELMGERACAFVVGDARFDVAECARWCAEQGLARYKTPEHVVVLDALPVLASGKADKAALRALAATRSGPASS